eukprot:721805-Prymnesium_polylepis.1
MSNMSPYFYLRLTHYRGVEAGQQSTRKALHRCALCQHASSCEYSIARSCCSRSSTSCSPSTDGDRASSDSAAAVRAVSLLRGSCGVLTSTRSPATLGEVPTASTASVVASACGVDGCQSSSPLPTRTPEPCPVLWPVLSPPADSHGATEGVERGAGGVEGTSTGGEAGLGGGGLVRRGAAARRCGEVACRRGATTPR